MFWEKGCPRCSGDLLEDRDRYGRYLACVQCGHYLSQAEEVVLRYSAHSPPTAPSIGETSRATGAATLS